LLLLALVALAAFATSFPGAYLLDDFPIIQDNPLVIEPDVKTILVSDYWGPEANSRLHRPLTILSYALNRACFGPAAFSFHLVNVLLHVGVTLLLYVVLMALGRGAGVSWTAAALFAVHPIHTEVVDIITGRAELLAALFMFLGLLLAYRRGRLHHLWVGVSHAAALLSKETAAVFPLLLFLGDAFVERDVRALLRRRWRLYAQSAAITLAWLALRSALPSASRMAATVRPLDNPLVDLTLPWRVLTTLKVQLLYLGKLLVPAKLHVVYVKSMMGPVTSLSDPWWVAVLLIVAGIVGLAILGWRRQQAFALGAAWYAAGFLVTANPFVLPEYLMAERFAYTPSAGYCLAAASLIGAALARITDQQRRQRAAVAVVGTILLLLAGRTLARSRDFQDHVRLWEVETRNAPTNIRAWYFLANAYELQQRWPDAERAMETAARLGPGLAETWIFYGALYQQQGRESEARDAFRRSLDTGLTTYEALEGYTLASLRLGFPRDALAMLRGLAELYRGRGGYWRLVGLAQEAAGNQEGAVEAYRLAVGIADAPPDTRELLRDLLARMGRGDAAADVKP
jgi:tetratricopeptide (TPR) repeat protein